MPLKTFKFTGRVDRRSPHSEGDFNSPLERENFLSRDGVLKKPLGFEKQLDVALSGVPTWMGRYYTVETGAISPKTFIYTQDGVLWFYNQLDRTATVAKENLNTNAYPRHWPFKLQTQTIMYFVDGQNLFSYDGNEDFIFTEVTITDTEGDTINPIDVIEHKDRLFLISEKFLFVSKNLQPEVFNDATDSIQLVVGSGKGSNLAVRKIEDKLYVLNTEGIFVLDGDVISAVASTFEIRLVDERKIIAGRSAVKVEKAILFVADDLNIWSWDGITTTKMSHSEKIEDFLNDNRQQLDKMTATYFNNYYQLSIVEKGETKNTLEIWWDALESKIEFVRGRYVSSYLEIDAAKEQIYQQIGYSSIAGDKGEATVSQNTIMTTERGRNWEDEPIITRLRTRDITPQKGRNVRFLNFFPEIEPIGNFNVLILYLLDGRQSDFDNTAQWIQSLKGETHTLGAIEIANQAQTLYRVKPRINYARGTSISFFLKHETKNVRFNLIGITVEWAVKSIKKGRLIGQ